MHNDLRLQLIKDWLNTDLQLNTENISAASSDASFRRYFRVVHDAKTYIVMDAPPEQESITKFIHAAEILKNAGLLTPDIIARNRQLGFLLLEDFGSSCFLDIISNQNHIKLYRSAIDAIIKLQTQVKSNDVDLPVYDRALLHKELMIFEEWFLFNYKHICPDENDKKTITHCWELLVQSALEQPYVCVHRDFHCRNLMYLGDKAPGILDFQDAVIGPLSYDLASLLKDCYISWPPENITVLQDYYLQQLPLTVTQDFTRQQFKRWFDFMAMQRHLKAIGIFSRLNLRDNKQHYMADIPRTMQYVMQVCETYPEFDAFGKFLLKIR